MPALLAVHPSRALREDPTVEIPMSRPLHASPQPTVRALETLLVDLQEAIEMMNQRPIQDRALRVPGSVGDWAEFTIQ